jgi:hypothetical protein
MHGLTGGDWKRSRYLRKPRQSPTLLTVWRQEHLDVAAGRVATVDGAIAHAADEENGPPAFGDALRKDIISRQRVTGHRPTIQQPDDPACSAVISGTAARPAFAPTHPHGRRISGRQL